MGFRDRLKRLEREARKEMIEIPQRDGTVKMFPRGALVEAFFYLIDVAAGRAPTREEPEIFDALRNAREPAQNWMGSFYFDPAEAPAPEPVPDLSEPAYGEKPLQALLPQNGKIAFARERSIAFASDRGDSYQICTVEPDGSSLRKLTKDTHVNPRPASKRPARRFRATLLAVDVIRRLLEEEGEARDPALGWPQRRGLLLEHVEAIARGLPRSGNRWR